MSKHLHALARMFFNPVFLARAFFILLTTWCGMLLGQPNAPTTFLGFKILFGYQIYERLLYSAIGFFGALIITVVEHATDAISSHKLLMAVLGLTTGLLFSSLFYTTIPTELTDPATSRMVCNLFFGYFGIVLAIKHSERFHLSRLQFLLHPQSSEQPKVLDSSVIIDGRIRELIDLKVIAGPIIIPNFVLMEIQGIADSNDPNRKARGRRGLDVLETLREGCKTLELIDKDFPEQVSVDQKLILLCREMSAELITNDFNLQKIGQLHRLTVININEIANALKPTVYIGETFQLTLVREGKESGQGVGYLEDGTMVVVDDTAHLLGQEITVMVSSILQTPSGRLVFGRHRDEEPSASRMRA